jgi:hypothetical protein
MHLFCSALQLYSKLFTTHQCRVFSCRILRHIKYKYFSILGCLLSSPYNLLASLYCKRHVAWDMFCASPSPSGHSKQICRPSIHVSELFSLCVSTKQARAHLIFLRSFLSEISKRPLSTSYVYAVCSSSYIKTCSRVFVCTCAF